jgi:hypothetical protein
MRALNQCFKSQLVHVMLVHAQKISQHWPSTADPLLAAQLNPGAQGIDHPDEPRALRFVPMTQDRFFKFLAATKEHNSRWLRAKSELDDIRRASNISTMTPTADHSCLWQHTPAGDFRKLEQCVATLSKSFCKKTASSLCVTMLKRLQVCTFHLTLLVAKDILHKSYLHRLHLHWRDTNNNMHWFVLRSGLRSNPD